MPRYVGTVVRVNPSNDWCFIDRKTIKLEDGTSTSLETTKDIYLHREDCDVPLTVSLEVIFEVAPDERRSQAFRAYGVKPVVYEPPDIELHIDEKHVDNPAIPMRWCFSGAMHRRITDGLRKGYGYAVMIVAKQQGDDEGFREIRDVRSWMQTFSITTFGAPGDWDVCIVLYERRYTVANRSTSYVLEQGMKAKLLDFTRGEQGRRTFDKKFPDLREFATGQKFHRYQVNEDWGGSGAPIAARTITVSVPSGIFAKEPSKALKSFGNYFLKYQPVDQCDLRRRLIVMFTVGWLPWLVFEAFKRLALLLLALALMLFCVRDWWKVGDAALEPAIKANIDDVETKQVDPFNLDQGRWFWFTPGFLIIYGVATSVLWLLGQLVWLGLVKLAAWFVHLFAHTGVAIAVSLITAVIVVGVCAGFIYGLDRYNKWLKATYYERRRAREKRRELQRQAENEWVLQIGQRQAVLAERQTTALVCGDAPAVVALAAIPRELRTREMLFAAFKQKVCRPFAR